HRTLQALILYLLQVLIEGIFGGQHRTSRAIPCSVDSAEFPFIALNFGTYC
ncbi:hypothetical protein L873DRAFT_1804207, partial [Choiromyces venosus 120613-1]